MPRSTLSFLEAEINRIFLKNAFHYLFPSRPGIMQVNKKGPPA
jgi:hypothetical protein